jgi:RNase adaptor protein for sRNA GlmZ degradation
MPPYSEEDFAIALKAFRKSEHTSIRICAYAFDVPRSTLASRLQTRTSHSLLHKSQNILSIVEEETLMKSITRLSKSDYPITLLSTRELAEEIQLSRFPIRIMNQIGRTLMTRS